MRRMTPKGYALLAVAAAAGLLLLASPARAGDEFEDAFKSELGRIAARGAVDAGRQVLRVMIFGAGEPPRSDLEWPVRRYRRARAVPDHHYEPGFRAPPQGRVYGYRVEREYYRYTRPCPHRHYDTH